MGCEIELIVDLITLGPIAGDRRIGSNFQTIVLFGGEPHRYEVQLLCAESTFEIRFAQKCTLCMSESARSKLESVRVDRMTIELGPDRDLKFS